MLRRLIGRGNARHPPAQHAFPGPLIQVLFNGLPPPQGLPLLACLQGTFDINLSEISDQIPREISKLTAVSRGVDDHVSVPLAHQQLGRYRQKSIDDVPFFISIPGMGRYHLSYVIEAEYHRFDPRCGQ